MILTLKILSLIFVGIVIASDTEPPFHMSNSTTVLLVIWVYWLTGLFI